MRAACAAIDYWCAMREEVSREAHRRAADVAIRNEEGYKRKLCEIHSAYKRAKTKQNELWQHSQDLEADKKELQNKPEIIDPTALIVASLLPGETIVSPSKKDNPEVGNEFLMFLT